MIALAQKMAANAATSAVVEDDPYLVVSGTTPRDYYYGSRWAKAPDCYMDRIHTYFPASFRTPVADEIAPLFERLYEQWQTSTALESSLTRIVMHPAYLSMISLGNAALPLIFRKFAERAEHWIWALTSITRETIGTPTDSFEQVRQAWLHWGRTHGYLGD